MGVHVRKRGLSTCLLALQEREENAIEPGLEAGRENRSNMLLDHSGLLRGLSLQLPDHEELWVGGGVREEENDIWRYTVSGTGQPGIPEEPRYLMAPNKTGHQ